MLILSHAGNLGNLNWVKHSSCRSSVTHSYQCVQYFRLSKQWYGWQCLGLEHQTRDRKVPGSSPGRTSRRIFFSSVNFLCWFLFRYLFHPCVTAVAHKNPGHSAKSASGRLQLNTHMPYLCGFEWSDTVNWCMVEWCTQNLHWDGSISPDMRYVPASNVIFSAITSTFNPIHLDRFILSHASTQEKTRRFNGFKFHTFIGCFWETLQQWRVNMQGS